jgi:sodium/potassium-transporting ATPase subunit beta
VTFNFFKHSVMDYDGVDPNPGLGFRPQTNPENDLIYISETDYKTLYSYMDVFLKRYDTQKTTNFIGANKQEVNYNYEKVLEKSSCTRENYFGYMTGEPCVALKLNRIYGWLPKVDSAESASAYPFNVSDTHATPDRYVYVHCTGEGSADKDNIGPVAYYSSLAERHDVGGINFKYFPYRNQANYLSPLVFVQFKNITVNTLVNVECKAYAKNIKNKDRMNRRGLARFQLYVEKTADKQYKQ